MSNLDNRSRHFHSEDFGRSHYEGERCDICEENDTRWTATYTDADTLNRIEYIILNEYRDDRSMLRAEAIGLLDKITNALALRVRA